MKYAALALTLVLSGCAATATDTMMEVGSTLIPDRLGVSRGGGAYIAERFTAEDETFQVWVEWDLFDLDDKIQFDTNRELYREMIAVQRETLAAIEAPRPVYTTEPPTDSSTPSEGHSDLTKLAIAIGGALTAIGAIWKGSKSVSTSED